MPHPSGVSVQCHGMRNIAAWEQPPSLSSLVGVFILSQSQRSRGSGDQENIETWEQHPIALNISVFIVSQSQRNRESWEHRNRGTKQQPPIALTLGAFILSQSQRNKGSWEQRNIGTGEQAPRSSHPMCVYSLTKSEEHRIMGT